MMGYSKIAIMIALLSLLGSVGADSVSFLGNNGQLFYYNVTLNKTPTAGIYTFTLIGTYGLLNEANPSAYSNCITTNIITCNVVFVAEIGNYTQMEVFNDGASFEFLNLTSPLSYYRQSSLPPFIINVIPWKLYARYAAMALAGIASILIIGNILYYIQHKKEIYEPFKKVNM